jgi:hypothetical protein
LAPAALLVTVVILVAGGFVLDARAAAPVPSALVQARRFVARRMGDLRGDRSLRKRPSFALEG